MGSVTFLPQELSGSDERCGVFKLPSDDVGPLVKFQGEITMALDPIGIGRIHDGLAGWSDCNGFGKITLARLSDPSYFRSESFNMVLLNF